MHHFITHLTFSFSTFCLKLAHHKLYDNHDLTVSSDSVSKLVTTDLYASY